MKNNARIILRLPEEIKTKFEKLAKKSRRNPSAFHRLLIEDAIKNKVKI